KRKLKNFYDPKTAGGCGVVPILSCEYNFETIVKVVNWLFFIHLNKDSYFLVTMCIKLLLSF
ncbi:hypothetical protein WCT96_11975, partial [Pectobacterium carotovorum]